MTTQKFKPIPFSTEMVQSILDGRKTQTRRIIKDQPKNYNRESIIDRCNYKNGNFCLKHKIQEDPERFEITDLLKSRYEINDILWVRETFIDVGDQADKHFGGVRFHYKTPETFVGCWRWKPSIHMPKVAARIFLKVTGVRVERLQDISEEDAVAEGVFPMGELHEGINYYNNYLSEQYHFVSPENSFFSLWQKINGVESCNQNPFVWVYEFERIELDETQSNYFKQYQTK